MSEGNDRPAPVENQRRLRKWVGLGLLSLLMITSAVEVVGYLIHSQRNQAFQESLSAQHQRAENETSSAANPGTAQAAASSGGQEKAPVAKPTTPKAGKLFFQVIGLTQDSLRSFAQQNEDTVGWITIDSVVDQPIVYRDNTYYLTHDFSGAENTSGAIFLDVNHPIRQDSQNLVIWGHNMKDGSMFGRLNKYLENNYLHSHNLIRLETRWESFQYIIFAVALVSTDTSSPRFLPFWMNPTFADERGFDAYIDQAYQQSIYSRYLDVRDTDTLLTLATCYEEDRLVLLARRQRADETENDIQHAMLALYPR